MKRSWIFIVTALLLAPTRKLPGAEFVVIGSDLTATIVSDDSRVTVGRTRTEEPEAIMWSRETGVLMLGTLPGDSASAATDISADGSVVVGTSGDIDFPTSTGREPFMWTEDNGIVGLGHLPGFTHGRVESISEDGSTAVGYLNNSEFNGGDWQAFRWTDTEGMIGMMPPGMTHSRANDVSADGRVIIGDAAKNWINDLDWNGFIWDEASGFQDFGPNPPGFEGLNPWLVSTDGSVVFGKDYPVGWSIGRPFRWTAEEGAQPLLGYSEATSTGIVLNDMTPDGSVLIGFTYPKPEVENYWRAFVWDERHGTRDLRQMLIDEHGFSDQDLPTLYAANGISADTMTIVGSSSFNENRGAWAIYLDKPLVSPFGDFDEDHYRTAADIDLLSQAVLAGNFDPVFDLNSDGLLDSSDRNVLVHDLVNTYFGDANLDGMVNASDLNEVGFNWLGAAGWAGGDFTGDGLVNAADLNVLGFQWQKGVGPGTASPLPEPAAAWLSFSGALLVARRLRRGR